MMYIKTKYLFVMFIIIHLKQTLTCDFHNYLASLISLVLCFNKKSTSFLA